MALSSPLNVRSRKARVFAWIWFLLIGAGAVTYAIFLLVGAARDSRTPIVSVSFDRRSKMPVPPFSFCITSEKARWGELTVSEISVQATTKLVETIPDPDNMMALRMVSSQGFVPVVNASGSISVDELEKWTWTRTTFGAGGFPQLKQITYRGVSEIENRLIMTDTGETFHCLTLDMSSTEVAQTAVVAVQIGVLALPVSSSGTVLSQQPVDCNDVSAASRFNGGAGCPWTGVQGYVRNVTDDVFRESFELSGDTYALVRASETRPYRIGKKVIYDFQPTFQFRGLLKRGYLEIEFPVQGIQINREQNPWLQVFPLIGSVLAFIPVGFGFLFVLMEQQPEEREFLVTNVWRTLREQRERRSLSREKLGNTELPPM